MLIFICLLSIYIIQYEKLGQIDDRRETTTKEIVFLRKLDRKLSENSIQELKIMLLDRANFCLGAYTKTQANTIYQQAIALGLKAKIF